MDQRISKYFDVECRIKDIYLNETLSFSERRQVSIEIAKDMPEFDMPQEIDQGIKKFCFSPLTSHTYKIVHDHFRFLPEEKVTGHHIEMARVYTSSLLGDNLLKNTEVIIVPANQWGQTTAEAVCISNGFDNHFVFMPECFSSPVELLCHELAHAAHHSARRKSDDFWSLPTNIVSAEFVAHFCQNRYILDNLTQAHFLAALGQLVTATFALSIFKYGKVGDFDGFIKSEESLAIRNGWDEIMIKNYYEIFSSNISYLRYEVCRGVGLIMALALIDEVDGVREFMGLDRINIRFDDLLDVAFPGVNHQSNFENINAIVINLLNRF